MSQAHSIRNEPIAIVGMGCRLPGANNLGEYWQLLNEGQSAVAEMPPDRLNQRLYYDPKVGVRGKTYSKLAALLKSREFDRRACPLPDDLIKGVDLCHLLMCQTAAEALRHAGMDPFDLKTRNVGVYIGHAQGSELASDLTYTQYIEEAVVFLQQLESFRQLGQNQQRAIVEGLINKVRTSRPRRTIDSPDLAANMVAGTIAQGFGLDGPFLAMDSACASSLQAMLYGARALQLGQVDMAIVGGASDVKSDSLVLFSAARALSATGTRPFDNDADGLIIAEGYVVLAMKTLRKAIADRDPIQAVVRGLGVSTDGKGKSLWAPLKEGQKKAMQRAYQDTFDLSSLQYIECHATATQVGDATELQTLADFLGPEVRDKKIPIGSVKANIGHTLEAAGMAGLIKTVLAMQHRVIPPAINVRNLNENVDWNSAPIFVPTDATPWPEPEPGNPRRAGVNAFGIGGLNMHVVLEEYQPQSAVVRSVQPPSNSKWQTAQSQAQEPVAIVGMGCLFAGANNLDEFWDLIQSGRDPKQTPPEDRWRIDTCQSAMTNHAYRREDVVGGFITSFEYDWRRHKVPPRQVQQADPLQFMLLEAADQAMRHAGFDKKEFDHTRTGVLVGSEFGGDFAFQLQLGLRIPEMAEHLTELMAEQGIAPDVATQIIDQYGENLLKHWTSLIDETGSFTSSTLASRLAKTWNVQGGAAAVDSGAGSSLATLSTAINLLASRDVDMMICATGQRRMGIPAYEGLIAQDNLAREVPARSPLDRNASGVVPGEGVGAVVMKRLSDARKDGDKVYAIIHDIGFGRDDATDTSLQLAINRSLSKSKVAAKDVALFEFNGGSSPEENQRQLATIAEQFGGQRSQPMLVSSITGQIGHTEGGAGIASIIKASLELEHGNVPRTVGLTETAPPLAAPAFQAVSSDTRLQQCTADGRQFAAVSTFSRGLAMHAILERGTPIQIPMTASQATDLASDEYFIVRIGASDATSLASTMRQTDVGQALSAAAKRNFGDQDNVRVTIVANSPTALQEKLATTAGKAANPTTWPLLRSQGVFICNALVNKPRIAFMFSGQGSQYTGMCRSLVEHHSAAGEALSKANAALAQAGLPSFETIAWSERNSLGKDLLQTQLAILIADSIFYAALTDAGVSPDVMAGHSYGEFPALLTSEVWDLPTAIAVTQARCSGIEQAGSLGGMLATTLPPLEISRLAKEISDPVYVANHNAPDQTVVGGSHEAIDQFESLLKSKGLVARRLAVPAPFHTPLMRRATGPIQQALRAASLHAPTKTIYSVATNQVIRAANEIPHNLVNHLINPLRYVDLVRQIADEQPTVFVEVGPGQALTRLHRRIDASILAIASDDSKVPAAEAICRVVAYLEATGAIGGPVPRETTVDAVSIHPAKISTATATSHQNMEPEKTILQFDATQRRRDKMRAVASGKPASKVRKTVTSVAQPPPQVAAQTDPPAPTTATASIAAPSAAPSPVSPSPTAESPSGVEGSASTFSAPADADLEEFLIDFVVEQTGYPPEVVELDADLEADLGIDSIKKAQLFAELNQHFAITPTEDLTLDDFPTLRHVVEFLRAADSSPPPSAVQSPSPTSVVAAPSRVHERDIEPTPQVSSPLTPATQSSAQLETFLIDFVVEQTGYPPEVVELDADLEADLGIDSIKKAQLFAELNEHFQITPTEDLSLDDFPTLRHVVEFLAASGSSAPTTIDQPEFTAAAARVDSVATAPALKESTPVAAAVRDIAAQDTAAPHDTADLESFLINFVVEQTGYPPEVVELDADLEADLGIDSIKKAQLFAELNEHFQITPTEDLTLDDFPTLRHVVGFLAGANQAAPQSDNTTPVESRVAPQVVVAPPPAIDPEDLVINQPTHTAEAISEPSGDVEDLESFLINFVVEQTGYPPEVVELDADLEADLGIDSIKKAQLFAELNEHFQIKPTEDLSLDDFPTLRHVWEFLAAAGSSVPSTDAAPAQTVASAPQTIDPTAANVFASAGADAAESTVAVELQGTPFEMGRQQAHLLRPQALRSLRRLADLTSADFEKLALPMQNLDRPGRAFEPDELDELRGLAEGLEVPVGNVVAFNLVVAAKTRLDASGGRGNGVTTVFERLSDWLTPVRQSRQYRDGQRDLTSGYAGTIGTALDPQAAGRMLSSSDDAMAREDDLTDLFADVDNGLASRCLMRVVETPLSAEFGTIPVWRGAAVIVGGNQLASTLKSRLEQSGVAAFTIDANDVESGLQQFEQRWNEAPIYHLFILTSREAGATTLSNDQSWEQRLQRGVMTPFFICQRWMQRAQDENILDQCSVVSLINLNGNFGFDGAVKAPESGALTGLMKAIYIESVVMHRHQGLVVKAIDSPADEADHTVIDDAFREIAAATIDYEVSYVGGRRHLQNASPQPVHPASDRVKPGGTWIVTGGARGITAECARQLALRFGVKLHLIGTTPKPDIQDEWTHLDEAAMKSLRSQTMVDARARGEDVNLAWQRVQAAIEIDASLKTLSDAGISYQYHACDVADRDALAKVLAEIRQSDSIHGILHGAGIDRSCRFEKKTRENVDATFGAKVVGAYNLMALTWHDDIRHFIGFGSVSGRLGSNGQADYCAASDMLCKLISWYGQQRPGCRAIGFHFHPWDEVGMAASPDAKKMIKAGGGPELMPKEEGVRHFLRELYAADGATEVLITNREYFDRFYGKQVTAERPADAVDATQLIPLPAKSRVTDRMVTRMMIKPLTPNVTTPSGTAFIYGENEAARQLQSSLQRAGCPVHIEPESADAKQAILSLQRFSETNGSVRQLFIMSTSEPKISSIDRDQISQRRQVSVETPFRVCQHWLGSLAGDCEGTSLIACTRMGGDFGLSGQTSSVEGGGIAGLIKGLDIEAPHQGWNGLQRKTIDFDASAAGDFIAAKLLEERGDSELEVGYIAGQRHVVRVCAQEIDATSHEITRGGTWVLTGGARGVTAEVALNLGKRYDLKLHLLGSSPVPEIDSTWCSLDEDSLQKLKAEISVKARQDGQSPRAAWQAVEKAIEIARTLQRFSSAGVSATYHCCDVLDRRSLWTTLDAVRRASGPIEGIVHGAGVAIDAWFLKKKPENVSTTIGIKVDALADLMTLTASDPVRYLVGFGSVSGRFGAKGQADYCVANEMMCKLINAYAAARPDCKSIGVHWHAWGEVGMAMKPELKAMFEEMDFALMPPAEGVDHLVRELTGTSTDTEVIFTDAEHYRQHYARDVVVDSSDKRLAKPLQRKESASGKDTAPTSNAARATASGNFTPLVDQVVDRAANQQLRAIAKLDPTREPFLIEHCMGGRPFLPAVIASEFAAEAASLLVDGKRTIELQHVELHNGLAFQTDDIREVRADVLVDSGEIRCRLTADHTDRRGRLVEADRLLLTAKAVVDASPVSMTREYCGEPPLGWFPMEYPGEFAVQHGPKFRCLKNLFCQHDGGFGRLIAPPMAELAGNRLENGWHLPPSVLDGCLVACSTYSFVMFQKRIEIPLGFDRLQFVDLPKDGEECIVRMLYRGIDPRVTRYDFVLFGADQRVLLAAEGYQSVNLAASRKSV